MNKNSKHSNNHNNLKPHHAKPFRKRHLGLLILSLISVIALLSLIVTSTLSNKGFIKDAKNLVSNAFNSSSQSSASTTIVSNYGFSLDYDPQLFYASALDSAEGRLYSGQELAAAGNYNVIKVGQAITDSSSSIASGSLNLEFHYTSPTGSSADLAKLETQYVESQNKSFSRVSSSTAVITGQSFLKTEWTTKPAELLGESVASKLTSYTGVVNGAPLTITINYGIEDNPEINSSLNGIVDSLKLNPLSKPLSTLPQSTEANGPGLLDRLLMTEQASASAFSFPNASERISTLYGPSVVKLYNAYCMDVVLSGQLFVQDACSASTGSGFFVGNDGHIATNGHVAVNNPLDIAITYAFDKISKGDATYLNTLADAASLTNADIAGAPTQQEQIKIIVDKLYAIPEGKITSRNSTENILVGLGEKQPDLKRLLSMTEARQLFIEEDTIKQGRLIAYNYRAIDGADTGVFRASDVAIVKVSGSGYPSTNLGSISSLTQGSGLSIIGYPGAASSNQLVESTQSRATLTSGKVSSIKSATGSKAQLIETDATIGHGNSGGPAFNDAGEVVGIATYTIDGSGDGNGVFNYIRDIADLQELASSKSVDISSVSTTQTKWQEGIENFYQAKYTKALKDFSEVKSLYPQHPKVDQLMTLANQNIASGQEAKSIPLGLVAAAILTFVALVVSLLLIFRHHKKYLAYKTHMQQASSVVSPTPPPPQAPLQNPPQAT